MKFDITEIDGVDAALAYRAEELGVEISVVRELLKKHSHEIVGAALFDDPRDGGCPLCKGRWVKAPVQMQGRQVEVEDYFAVEEPCIVHQKT